MCSTNGYKVQFPQAAGTCLSRSPHVPETTIRQHLMTRQNPPTLSPPPRDKRLWRWLIEPSPRITEPDQRRQASLLTGFLLGSIVLGIVLETVTTLLLAEAGYTGYQTTIISVLVLALVYAVSRTQYVQVAGILAVVVISLAIFLLRLE